MRSCFRELGLSEYATKAQVEEAYARRVARYKGPDYAEEPEYVHRKLTALRAAYEEARQIARTGDGSGYKPVVREEERRNTLKPVKKKAKTFDADYGDDEHAFSEKFHQWLEKRDDNKARKSNKSGKKDRQKKKGGMIEDLKNIDAEKLKSAWKEFKSDALGLGHTPLVQEEETIDVEIFDFLRDDDDDADYVFTDSGQRLGESGTVVSEPKEEKSKGSEIISVIATVLIAAFTLFGSCGDDSISYEDEYDYVDEYGIEYEYDYIDYYTDLTDEDLNVKKLAEGSSSHLFSQDGYGTAHWRIDEDEELRPRAEEFAKKYWSRDSLEEVTEYLQIEFENYPGDTSMTLDQQLNYIFPFYGFMTVDEVQWYEQPYTGGRIQCFAEYLEYLNRYYDEYYQNKIQNAQLTENNLTDSDLIISDMASASAELLYEQESESFSYNMLSMEDESALASQAATFAKCYWGKDTIKDVTLYLSETYETYPTDSTESLEAQLDAIFTFYGFAPVEDVVWYKNPYTQGIIKSYTYYLIYLIDYYEATQ